MLSNVMSTLMLPSPVSVLGTWKATRGFIAFRRSSKLSTSISRNLRSATARQRLGRLARQVRHHAHDERQLDLLLRAVDLDVVLDLHARRAVARDEFLAAFPLPSCIPPVAYLSPSSIPAVK